MWQDIVLSAVIFVLSLLPIMLANSKHNRVDIPYSTIAPTAIMLFIFSITFYALALYISSYVCLILATIWSLIAIQKKHYEKLASSD